MKKDWLKDIHDRMADFEVEVPVTRDQKEQPQGLWEDICAAESAKIKKPEKTPVIGNRRKVWIGSSTVAAAGLLLFWFMHPKNEQVTETLTLPAQEVASTDLRPSSIEESLPNILEESKPMIMAATTTNPKSRKSIPEAEEANETIITEELGSGKTKEPEKTNVIISSNERHKRRTSDPRLTVGLSSSGGIGSGNRQLFQRGYAGANSMLSESDWVDSPLLGIMALNRGVETERKVTHHAPIRTGLSLTYKVNDRWSIESGLTYAFVSSDIHEGSVSNFIEEKQNLHYVGIPLGATYRLLSWKRLDLYLSANILAEQCVSGESRKKYFISDKKQGEEAINTLQSRPMQWSVGTKAGVQYNLNSLLSIYVEPGCSYYFDDRSSLETVFKDKVFDFNLNLGLRFSVGK